MDCWLPSLIQQAVLLMTDGKQDPGNGLQGSHKQDPGNTLSEHSVSDSEAGTVRALCQQVLSEYSGSDPEACIVRALCIRLRSMYCLKQVLSEHLSLIHI